MQLLYTMEELVDLQPSCSRCIRRLTIRRGRLIAHESCQREFVDRNNVASKTIARHQLGATIVFFFPCCVLIFEIKLIIRN